jgi:hypothetical protein
MKKPLKHPSSEPLWIAVGITYGIFFAGLYVMLIYARSHGIPLP